MDVRDAAGKYIDDAFVQWKLVYIDGCIAENNVELAKSVAREHFRTFGVDYFITSVGTFALQPRETTSTDHDALLAELVKRRILTPKKRDALVAKYTTTTQSKPVLSASPAWRKEAGL